MQDYSISKCTRKCASSGRDLEPGEQYISVILPHEDGEGIRRLDIATSEWKGPQEETIGWWKSQMPKKAARKLKPAPNGVLLDTLTELVENPDSADLSYLLALLLVRRRVLSEEESIPLDESQEGDGATTYWNLVCNADSRVWNVPQIEPTPQRLHELQEQLHELLFTEE